jgi:hypothetical protein
MNGLHMSHPENTYSYILKELTGISTLSVAASANALGNPPIPTLYPASFGNRSLFHDWEPEERIQEEGDSHEAAWASQDPDS